MKKMSIFNSNRFLFQEGRKIDRGAVKAQKPTEEGEKQETPFREKYQGYFGLDDDIDQPFDLDDEILQEYEDVRAMNDALDEKIKLTISATFKHNRSVERFLEAVSLDRPTGDVEYHIGFIRKTLSEVKVSEFADGLNKFIRGEESRLADNIEEAKRVIGSKKRDSDGVYR